MEIDPKVLERYQLDAYAAGYKEGLAYADASLRRRLEERLEKEMKSYDPSRIEFTCFLRAILLMKNLNYEVPDKEKTDDGNKN